MATIEKPVQQDTCEHEELLVFDAIKPLEGEDAEQLTAHLRICERCRWVRDQMKLPIEKVGMKRYALKLREPKDGIPLQNDRQRIEQCAEHFAPMIDALTHWCQENGIAVDRTLRFTGEIIVNATPDQLRHLEEEAERLGFFDETKERPYLKTT